MGKGATVSDLHMFSHHSRPERYLSRIQDLVSKGEVFVLNGDIFDFKWSEHGVFSRSVLAAEQFIESLLDTNKNCQIHVVLGNHDAVPPYIRALRDLAGKYENLHWHEFACVIGDRLFLHGDVIHAGSNNEAVRAYRGKLQRPARGHRFQRLAHSALHGSHVFWMAFRLLPKRVLAQRILAYLKNEKLLEGRDVRHIYFGHTHSDFEDFSFRNFTFHNCGSATRGARLRIVEFPING